MINSIDYEPIVPIIVPEPDQKPLVEPRSPEKPIHAPNPFHPEPPRVVPGKEPTPKA